MKLMYKLFFCISTVLLSSLSFTVKAQGEENIIKFLNAGVEDGGKLITAYVSPFVEGFSYALNGAWFHTAKPHKTLGFDINIAVTPVFIPSSRDFFNANEIGLSQYTQIIEPASGMAPSIIGPKDKTTYATDVDQDGVFDVTYSGPEGLNLRNTINVAPVGSPMIQLGVGVFKNTDLMIRFSPEVKISNSTAKLLGFGLKHDIKQHIPGIKMLPFDLSVMAGYTAFEGVTDLSGNAEFPPIQGNTNPQEAIYKFNAFLIEALVSKKISFLTFFGGVGYNGIKTNADIKGSYSILGGQSNGGFDLVNPYSAEFKHNSMRLDLGMRMNILAFYLYGNYSIQEFNALTVGLGFTFR
ncbi:MAG: hypothetical protein KF687_06085 [Cyclobacteriaceae bacterium]|nr:hypothetical protein [Cyclobacteriaceae bacterium]